MSWSWETDGETMRNRLTRRHGDAVTGRKSGRGEKGMKTPVIDNQSSVIGKTWNLELGTPANGWRYSGRDRPIVQFLGFYKSDVFYHRSKNQALIIGFRH